MIAPSTLDANNIFARLAAPFQNDEVAWRVARAGIKHGRPWAQVLAYIDARVARARLNAVLGPSQWRVEYSYGAHGGVLATLSLRVDGEWIAKQDGADVTEREPVKGAISGALKRACAVWGIGEYLYDVGESWAVFSDAGAHRVQIDGTMYRWDAPKLGSGDRASAHAQSSEALRTSRVTRAGDDERVSEPFTGTLTAEVAGLIVMPFGKHRGRPLKEIALADLQRARDWALQKKRSYPAFMSAVEVLVGAKPLAA